MTAADAIWHPDATRRPLPDDMGGALTASRGLVLHVEDGDNDPWGWFNRPDVKASSHWWVSKAGALVQYIPADRVAWAQAAGNSGWHSVETEGRPAERLTPAQVATCGRLYAWGAAHWGWPDQIADSIAGRGLGTHGMGGAAWGGHTGCPGPLRTAQRADILAAARGTTTGATVAKTLTDDDRRDITSIVATELDRGTGGGQHDWEGTVRETLGAIQADLNADRATAAAVTALAAEVATVRTGLASLITPGHEAAATLTDPTADLLTRVAALGLADAVRVATAASVRASALLPTTAPPTGGTS